MAIRDSDYDPVCWRCAGWRYDTCITWLGKQKILFEVLNRECMHTDRSVHVHKSCIACLLGRFQVQFRLFINTGRYGKIPLGLGSTKLCDNYKNSLYIYSSRSSHAEKED